MLAKKLTKRPLAEVAFHRIPDTSRCDHAEAACCALIGSEPTALKNKRSAQDTFTLIADLLKFARFAQTLRSRDAHGSETSLRSVLDGSREAVTALRSACRENLAATACCITCAKPEFTSAAKF